jgi:hypothetical protein
MKIILLIIFSVSISLSQGIKTKSGAFWRSMLVPGWGNYYAGNNNNALWHLGAELSLWTGYLYHDYQYQQMERKYKRFASRNLSLDTKDYPSTFYNEIAKYNSYEQYHLFQLGQGKDPNSILADRYSWFWPSDGLRREYAEKRSEAFGSERKIKLWFYAMFANRLLAWISSVSDVKRANSLVISTNASFNELNGNQFRLDLSIAL